jgi:hypothetical protein
LRRIDHIASRRSSAPPSRIPSMEFLLLCVVSVLGAFTAGAYFASRGGD